MKPELSFGKRLLLEVSWCAAKLFACLPHWFKYHVVAPLLYLMLCYCLRYRKRVVVENLENAFPELTPEERQAIVRGFYRTLSELFVDMVNMAHMPRKKALRVLKIKDAAQHAEAVKGRDWIALSAHYACWEYSTYLGVHDPSQLLLAVYHPLKNAVAEQLMLRLRNTEASEAIPMKESLRFNLRHRDEGIRGRNLVMGLIADQSPPLRKGGFWTEFFHRETMFFDGGEKLALRCNLPVYFTRMKRLKAGIYEMSFEQLYDGVEQVEEYEITRRYVEKLEEMIRQQPELWLWSHRRWKRKRPV